MAIRVLFIGHVWPETRSSGAGIRTRAFVDQALEAGYEVHVAAPSKETVFTEELKALGVGIHFVEPNDPRFDAWISNLRPAAAVLDRFVIEEQFGWRIREHSPETAILLDTVDLHSLRRAREAHLKAWLATAHNGDLLIPPTQPELAREDTYRELASILRSDLSILISKAELILLKEMSFPDSKLLYLPYSYRPESFARSMPAFRERMHFVSLGNFRHPPNADSVRLLTESLWPALRRRLPDAELHLYGAYPPKELMDRNGRIPGLIVKGPCDDAIHTLSEYRVLLAPLRFGAGLKGKISDSWLAGTAVCTTSIGAEGLCDDAKPFAGRVEDRVESWLDAAVELYEDEAQWKCCQSAGRESALRLFDWKSNSRVFIDAIESLRRDLPSRRKKDYLQGAFLQQTASASKYLSKWIEAKNNPRNLNE